ncbi:MAG: outer membrane beta-barrel protein [Verrucomicrobia bacterium]|nr:outer membrane beta-barrel protein [Verrucomicrobiota bacterium]
MKKFLSTMGVVALGATSLHAQYAPGLSAIERTKPWSISASLRGFYDDNVTTSPNSVARDSFGIEVSPSVSLNLALDQTFIGASYVYSMRYYEDSRFDTEHVHQFNAKLDHAFSERYKLELNESFVIAQEPEVLDPTGVRTGAIRTEGDNIRNTASADFHAQLSPLLGTRLGYANNFYDYEQTGFNSRSALLDRMEHLATVNLRWQALRQTIGVLGYNFEAVDYTSSDPVRYPGGIAEIFFGIPSAIAADSRNRYTHYFYVGADHNFNARLNASARVGGQYTEYYNMVGNQNTIGPYADLNLTYTYMPGSFLQAGLRHSPNPTDLGAVSATQFVLNQESTSVYASLTHRITPRVTGNLLAQYQHSTANAFDIFSGETENIGSDNFFIIGLNVSYRINPYWMAETGYNFDRLDSDFPNRSYTRNRVYVGLRATY